MARLFDDASKEYLVYAGIPVTAYPFTMACWFMSDINAGAASNQTLIALSNTAVWHRLAIFGNVAGDPVRVQTNTSTTGNADTSTGYSTNVWQHAAGVWASTTSRTAYLNAGGAVTDTSSQIFGAVSDTYISAVDLSVQWMSGRIAEAAIWNVALNATEILALSKGVHPLTVRPDAIAAYWPLFGLDSPEPDLSPATVAATRYPLTLHGSVYANHAPVVFNRTRGIYLIEPSAVAAPTVRNLAALGVG